MADSADSPDAAGVTCHMLVVCFCFFPIKVLSSALCSSEGHIRKLQL